MPDRPSVRNPDRWVRVSYDEVQLIVGVTSSPRIVNDQYAYSLQDLHMRFLFSEPSREEDAWVHVSRGECRLLMAALQSGGIDAIDESVCDLDANDSTAIMLFRLRDRFTTALTSDYPGERAAAAMIRWHPPTDEERRSPRPL